jgi:hypothetical protein
MSSSCMSTCSHQDILGGVCVDCGEVFDGWTTPIKESKDEDFEIFEDGDKDDVLREFKIDTKVIKKAQELCKICVGTKIKRNTKIMSILYVCIYKACCIFGEKLPNGIPEKLKIKKKNISEALMCFNVMCEEYRTLKPQISELLIDFIKNSGLNFRTPVSNLVKLYYDLTERSQFLSRSSRRSVISGILLYLYGIENNANVIRDNIPLSDDEKRLQLQHIKDETNDRINKNACIYVNENENENEIVGIDLLTPGSNKPIDEVIDATYFKEKMHISTQTLLNTVKNIKETITKMNDENKNSNKVNPSIKISDISSPVSYTMTVTVKDNFNIDLKNFFKYTLVLKDESTAKIGDFISLNYRGETRGCVLKKSKKLFKASVSFYMYLGKQRIKKKNKNNTVSTRMKNNSDTNDVRSVNDPGKNVNDTKSVNDTKEGANDGVKGIKSKDKHINGKLSSNGTIHITGARTIDDIKTLITMLFKNIQLSERLTGKKIYLGNNYKIDNSPNIVCLLDIVMYNTVSQFPVCINREKLTYFINSDDSNYIAVYDPIISNDSHVRIIGPKQKKEHLIKLEFPIEMMINNDKRRKSEQKNTTHDNIRDEKKSNVLEKKKNIVSKSFPMKKDIYSTIKQSVVDMDLYSTIYKRGNKKNETIETFMIFSSGKIIHSSSYFSREKSYNQICDKLIKGSQDFCVF